MKKVIGFLVIAAFLGVFGLADRSNGSSRLPTPPGRLKFTC